MTTITLHDYLGIIDQLLDENHFSEAASHCRHILEQHPRHVDTYRTLARALLEQRQYEDAADLFQRVLSADPNDLVAHVGLADVYKQESLLDQSLWHLERAFELEPYNHVIQDELRQLYARHNDVTLERIPLNQGALARIYLKEELYQQAVSELEQALSHNGDRIDLEVTLAEALWRDGQRVDAAEVCRRILEQLPNCITANAILADIWLQAGQADEAQHYLQRVQALTQVGRLQLDLETAVGHAFSLEGAPSLPDEIKIEMLAMAPEDASLAAPPPDWVSEVTVPGAAAGQPAAETENGYEYDWLAGIDATDSSASADAPASQDSDFEDVADIFGEGEPLADDEMAGKPEFVDTANDMPSWLKEQEDTELFTHEEIPDWLSDEDVEDDAAEEAGAGSSEMSAGMPDWLADVSGVDNFEPMEVDPMLASEWFVESEEDEEALPAARTDAAGDDDEWLATLGTVTSASLIDDFEEDTGLEPGMIGEDDDWLAALARDTGELPKQRMENDDVPEPAELDGWLAEDTAAVAYGDDVTDWLSGSDLTEENELEEVMTDIPAGLPADDSDNKDSSLQGVPEPEDTTSDDLDDAMAWLDELTAAEDESEPAVMGELAGEELPDWLADLSGPAESGDIVEAAMASDYSDDDIPDWLRISSMDDELLSAEEAEAATADEDELSYVDRIAAGEGAPLDELPTQVSITTSEPEMAEDETRLSDWLSELEGEALPDEEAGALDWLDQLAAGTPVEQMPTLEWPEQSDEEEPALDWLAEMAAPPDETLVNLELVQEERAVYDAETAEDATVVDVPEDLDDAMAWLEELAAQQGAPVEELPTVANVLETDMELEELPGTKSVHEDSAEPEFEAIAEEAKEEIVIETTDILAPESDETLAEAEIDLDEAMAWLEDLMGQQDEPVAMWEEVEEQEEPGAAEMATDQDQTTVEAEMDIVPEAITAHDELDEALEWLEQRALEEGMMPEIEELRSVEVSDDELAAALEWLEQVAAGESPAPAEPADDLFDMPDDPEAALAWLEQLAIESGAEVEGDAWAEEEAEVVEMPLPAELSETLSDVEDEGAEEEAELEIDFLADMPDDPDEAMAWLEKLAARQGAPLEELPSISSAEDEELALAVGEMPAWLEAEVTLEEMEFAGEAIASEVELEETPADVEEQPDTSDAVEPEVEVLQVMVEAEAPEPDLAAGEEEQLEADESGWLEAASDVDVMGWLAAEEEATVIRSEEAAPVPATGPLFAAPPEKQAEIGDVPELDPEDESLILADVGPATSALALDEAQLAQARQSLASGNYNEAMNNYHSLVTTGEGLITLISDLETAVEQHPHWPLLRRVLGDAYMRNGQLQKALESYRETLAQL